MDTDHTQGVGRNVRIRDGRNLFLMEKGTATAGAPTIVFEAGMAAPRSSWGLVQPALPGTAHSITYDRAGLGRSDPDPQPRTVARMADDLDDLLDAFGQGPFILVATSGGALVAREAAKRRPEQIAGMVLVDPTDEGCEAVFAPSFRRFERFAHQSAYFSPGSACSNASTTASSFACRPTARPISAKKASPWAQCVRAAQS